jgi:hypothetical protein
MSKDLGILLNRNPDTDPILVLFLAKHLKLMSYKEIQVPVEASGPVERIFSPSKNMRIFL